MNPVFNCRKCGKFSSDYPLCTKCEREFRKWLRRNFENIDKKRREWKENPINIWIREKKKRVKKKDN